MPLTKVKYVENQNHLESNVCQKHAKLINFKYCNIIHFLGYIKFAWEVTIRVCFENVHLVEILKAMKSNMVLTKSKEYFLIEKCLNKCFKNPY